MKTRNLLLTLITFLLATTAVQAQNKVMRIHSGGSVAYAVNVSQIDSITFSASSLAGAKWKLNGIVNAETGAVTELDPKNDDRCYLLSFDEDTYTGVSSTNDLMGKYTADFETSNFEISVGGTHRGEVGDGYLYVDVLSSVQSFSLLGNELRLYYNEKKEYLSYRPFDAAKPVIPILITKGFMSTAEGVPKQSVVITTMSEWQAFSVKLLYTYPPVPSLDENDFEQYQIISVVDAIHSNGGWSIDITGITEYDDKIVVTYANLETGNATAVLSQPCHIVKIPKSDKTIEFVDKTLLVTQSSTWKCADYEEWFGFTVDLAFYPAEKKLQIKTTPEELDFSIMLGENRTTDYYISDNMLYINYSASDYYQQPWVITFLSDHEMLLDYGGPLPAVAIHPYLTANYRFIRQIDKK